MHTGKQKQKLLSLVPLENGFTEDNNLSVPLKTQKSEGLQEICCSYGYRSAASLLLQRPHSTKDLQEVCYSQEHRPTMRPEGTQGQKRQGLDRVTQTSKQQGEPDGKRQA